MLAAFALAVPFLLPLPVYEDGSGHTPDGETFCIEGASCTDRPGEYVEAPTWAITYYNKRFPHIPLDPPADELQLFDYDKATMWAEVLTDPQGTWHVEIHRRTPDSQPFQTD